MWFYLGAICLTCLAFCYGATPPPSYEFFYEQAMANKDFIIEKRRYLHQHPELYFQEFETSEYIQKTLEEMGVNYTSGWGKNYLDKNSPPGTGVVAEVGTGHPPCVFLRADIDGLPVTEDNDFPFKSTHEGKMHACGHDTHAAMLLGAAKILKEYESTIEGTVRMLFQPGEEGGGGGHMMTEEGVLEKYPPAQMGFGIHVGGDLPTGQMKSSPGPVAAAATDFVITVTGKGGHAAMHHHSIDPIPAGVAMVRAIYDMTARELYFTPDKAGLVSVCFFKSSSTATNVIPDEVQVGGTIRGLTTQTRDYIRSRVQTIAEAIAESYRCSVKVEQKMIVAYPALTNDPEAYKVFNDGLKMRNNGKGEPAKKSTPVMGGEDFSFFGERVPSVFASIGTGSGDEIPGHPPTNTMAHQSKFAVDERALPMGAAHHAYFAYNALYKFNTEKEAQENQDMNEKSTDKSMNEKSTDKNMEGETTDKSMEGETTDKSMEGETTNKSMNEKSTDKSMEGETTGNQGQTESDKREEF